MAEVRFGHTVQVWSLKPLHGTTIFCAHSQAYSKSGDLAPGFGVPWTVVKTLVTILDFFNEMLVLILEVCAVSMGIPYFAKVRPTPLPFYDRPKVVPVFAEYPKRIVVFTKKKGGGGRK